MRILVTLISFLLSSLCYSESSSVIKNEYLYISSIPEEHKILTVQLKIFGSFEQKEINKTTSLYYFKKDPGLKALKKIIKNKRYKGVMQPNFQYNLIQPVRPEDKDKIRLKNLNLKQINSAS